MSVVVRGLLFDTLIDVNDGYDELIARAEPSVRGMLKDLSDQHKHDIAEIETTAKSSGIEVDRSGTLMGDVQKAVVRVRDWLTDIDANVLEAVAHGEENVVSSYNSAIKSLPSSHDLHTVLTDQRQNLRGKISALFHAA